MKTLHSFGLSALTSLCATIAVSETWQNPAERYVSIHENYADATCPIAPDAIRNFVYFAKDRDALRAHPLLSIDRFIGAQIMYAWRDLEPSEGRYDFAAIREDVDFLASHGKRLFIQLQDASFSPTYRPVPDYMLTDDYDGGVIAQHGQDGTLEGWTAKRWNPAVQARFSALLAALGQEFDGAIEGINLQETSIEVTAEQAAFFTPQEYAAAIKQRMGALKAAFAQSVTLQYANFMPAEWLPFEDMGYLRGIYAYGAEIGVGLGAPDLMPQRKGQLNHAIALMHEGQFDVPLGIAVQDGNYIGETNSNQILGERRNLVPMLHGFAADFLKVDYMFWVNQEPYFTQDVLPCLAPAK